MKETLGKSQVFQGFFLIVNLSGNICHKHVTISEINVKNLVFKPTTTCFIGGTVTIKKGHFIHFWTQYLVRLKTTHFLRNAFSQIVSDIMITSKNVLNLVIF